MPTDPPTAVQDAMLNLLVRVNRLLAEADAVREIRDRVLATARDSMTAPADRPREVAHVTDR